MNASELRLGNIVEQGIVIALAEPWITVAPNLKAIGKVYVPFAITPVVISPESLLRLGFEKEGNNFHFNDFRIFTVFNDRVELEGLNWGDESLPYPKYIHNLQNIYFYIKQEELTIKDLKSN